MAQAAIQADPVIDERYSHSTRRGGESSEQDLVREYLPLVRKIAARLTGHGAGLPEFDDIFQAGMIGLLEALRAFDPGRGVAFASFARRRIHGAMVDEARRGTWVPRSVLREARAVDRATRDVENRYGRRARAGEVADRLGISAADLATLRDLTRSRYFYAVDSPFDADPAASDPLQSAQLGSLADALIDAMERLSEREGTVMRMYYAEELKLREIGQRLGLTESRICQLRKQALRRLGELLDAWRDEGSIAG